MRTLAAQAIGQATSLFSQFITAPRAVWQGIESVQHQRVYFASHSSNGDFVLIWTVLPPPLRRQTRPVAAPDYWLTDLPRVLHPATAGVFWSFASISAGCAIAWHAELSLRAAGRAIALARCRAKPAGVW